MKNFKIILFFLLLFFVSGCSANYDLNINSKLEITETLKLTEKYDVLFTYTASPNSYLNNELYEIKKDGTYSSYDLDAYIKNNIAYGEGRKLYKNFDNYKKNSLLYKEMFSTIINKQDGNIIALSMQPNAEFKYFEENSQYSSLLDDVTIKITLPFKVISNNADEVKNSTYIWNINKKTVLKELNLSFDGSKNLENAIPVSIWIIIGLFSGFSIIVIYIYIKYKFNSK